MKLTFTAGLALLIDSATAIPTASPSPAPTHLSTPDFAGGLGGSDGKVTGVSATYRAPSFADYDVEANGQAVVSIDTYQCPGYLQAGVRWTLGRQGNFQMKAFAQWGPAAPHIFDLTVTPGDMLTVHVTATEPGAGYASVTNDGKTVTTRFHNMTHLCQQSAAWGVVDPTYNATSPSEINTLGNYCDIVFFSAAYTATDRQGHTRSFDCSRATGVDMVRKVNGTQSTFSHAGIYDVYSESVVAWYGA